jgi:hypothetical protein
MTTRDTFFKKRNTVFIVRNLTSKKTVKVFNYPIFPGAERDILAIPEISESDIRNSLLKGELMIKFLAGEIIVVDSDIDLLQFNDDQKAFLTEIGVIKGLGAMGNSAAASTVGTTVSFTAQSTPQTFLSLKTTRVGATIFNGANKELYVLLGDGTVSTSNFTVIVPAEGGYYEVPYNYAGIITGIWDSGATGNARITEFTA